MIKRSALSAAMLVALAACSEAQGRQQGWTPVSYGGKPEPQQLYFVDTASIAVRADGAAEFLAMIVYRTPSERGVDRVVERTRADCADRSSRALEQLAFSGPNVKFRRGEQTDVERYEEGTPWRILVDSVCDGELPDLVVADPPSFAADYFAR